MSKKTWIIFAGLVLVSFVAILVFKPTNNVAFNSDPAKITADDHIIGSKDSKVVLIEYADFQCPGCKAAAPVVKQINPDYKDKIVFSYRYMPLTTIHPNAKASASAAEAAGRQGKFWEMHDLLFENQDAWASASASNRNTIFEQYAQQLKLNLDKYRTDVASKAVADRISVDQAAATKAGLELSTPTFVLNGKKLDLKQLQTDGAFTADKFKSVLDAAIASQGIELLNK